MLSPNVTRWRPLAAASAARWGAALGVTVPVELVLSMIQQESSGDPRAVRREPDGRVSRGLMQVLEGTARDLGVRNPLALHDPQTGIDTGVRYLAQKLKRYGGSVARAVAAYNAGSARYAKNDPGERFINQGYVDEVLARIRTAASSPAGLGTLAAVALVAGLYAARRRRYRLG